MSARRQSKRMAFNFARRRQRTVNRVAKSNSGKPGFIGVVTRLEVDGKSFGMGALFLS